MDEKDVHGATPEGYQGKACFAQPFELIGGRYWVRISEPCLDPEDKLAIWEIAERFARELLAPGYQKREGGGQPQEADIRRIRTSSFKCPLPRCI